MIKSYGFFLGFSLMALGVTMALIGLVASLPWSALLSAFSEFPRSTQVAIVGAIVSGVGIGILVVTGNS